MSRPGGDGVDGAADVPSGRGDVECEVEKEETVSGEAGGRVALCGGGGGVCLG